MTDEKKEKIIKINFGGCTKDKDGKDGKDGKEGKDGDGPTDFQWEESLDNDDFIF